MGRKSTSAPGRQAACINDGGLCPGLQLLDSFDFDGPRDPHRNDRDVGDPGCFHPAELAILSGCHSARDARRGLDKLSCFHDEFRLS